MRSRAWLAALVFLGVSCGSSPVAVHHGPSPATTASSSTNPLASPSPSASSGGTPTADPTAAPSAVPNCGAVQPEPQLAASAPGVRNLAIVWLKGGTKPVIRDLTDINHPSTIATLDIPAAEPRFVSATDVSWLWSDATTNLFRHSFTASPVLVAHCVALFDWSADGTAAAFVTDTPTGSELLEVRAGITRTLSLLQAFPRVGCESQSCGDSWQFKLQYSPDGSMISLIEIGGPNFHVWGIDGRLLWTGNGTSSMSVWSGSGLFYRDSAGVEVWRAGSVSRVLPGVAWIGPVASPGGGAIAYMLRDASGLPHVDLLDTVTGKARELASGADAPAFLTSRYLWYRGVSLCNGSHPRDCQVLPTTPTGVTYVLDLQTGTRFESIITSVADVSPHPA